MIRTTQQLDKATDLPEVLTRYRSQIVKTIYQEYKKYSDSLYNTHKYYLGFTDVQGNSIKYSSENGKVFRPTLVLMGCRAAGGKIERSMPIAVSLELIHNFSLIHDDIQDGDRFRHNRLSVWAVWGKPAAIISGLSMLKVAENTVKQSELAGVDKSVINEVQQNLTLAHLRMIEGQFLDISFESQSVISVDDYLNMVNLKTGALIEVSLVLGAMTGSKIPQQDTCDALRKLGQVYGRLFQISDDLLGIWGSKTTGKPIGADIKRRKKSLPNVYALNHSKAKKSRLHKIFAKKVISDSNVEEVLSIMNDMKTKEWCTQFMYNTWQQGTDIIQSLPSDRSTKQDLTSLGDFLITRHR